MKSENAKELTTKVGQIEQLELSIEPLIETRGY